MQVTFSIFFVGLVIFLAHLFAGVFSKTRVPDVLLLVVLGLVLGPILGWVRPVQLGVVGPVFTTITLIVILFESGIRLNPISMRKAFRTTVLLSVLSFAVTMGMVAVVSFLLTPLNMTSSLMLGAILGGTSSAVVIPLVEQLQMGEKEGMVLLLESALSDVLCILVALAFMEADLMGGLQFNLIVGEMISSFLLAGVCGVIAGVGWSVMLNKIRGLQNSILTTPAFVFVVFGLVELLGYSGAIAALTFGVTLGNVERIRIPLLARRLALRPISLNQTERVFFSELVFLLKTFFFIYIGISIPLTHAWYVSFGVFLVALIFLIRLPVVWVTVERTAAVRDASLMAVMVPKGLAAAVLASLPLQQGIAGGEMMQSVTYAVVLFSIVVTAVLVFLLDRSGLARVYADVFARFGQAPKA